MPCVHYSQCDNNNTCIPIATFMSLSKLSTLDHLKVSRRLQKAQATRYFSISTEFYSENLVKLVNAHSNVIGVPPEFILWPLLTTATLMGTNAAIKKNQEWSEPSNQVH